MSLRPVSLSESIDEPDCPSPVRRPYIRQQSDNFLHSGSGFVLCRQERGKLTLDCEQDHSGARKPLWSRGQNHGNQAMEHNGAQYPASAAYRWNVAQEPISGAAGTTRTRRKAHDYAVSQAPIGAWSQVRSSGPHHAPRRRAVFAVVQPAAVSRNYAAASGAGRPSPAPWLCPLLTPRFYCPETESGLRWMTTANVLPTGRFPETIRPWLPDSAAPLSATAFQYAAGQNTDQHNDHPPARQRQASAASNSIRRRPPEYRRTTK